MFFLLEFHRKFLRNLFSSDGATVLNILIEVRRRVIEIHRLRFILVSDFEGFCGPRVLRMVILEALGLVLETLGVILEALGIILEVLRRLGAPKSHLKRKSLIFQRQIPAKGVLPKSGFSVLNTNFEAIFRSLFSW